MSDLSRLLGDVYDADAATTSDAGADDRERLSGLPEWADDDVLDKAFENWVPGPPDDAPAAERGVLTDLASDPVVEVDEAIADDPTGDAGEPMPETVAAPLPETPAVTTRLDWQRSDDDIIVGHRRKGLFRR